VVSGSEAISSDSGRSLAPICHSPSRSSYSSPSVYQSDTYGRSVSSIVSLSGYQP
jgi:hypothetical protein